jgi:hypothetical protein
MIPDTYFQIPPVTAIAEPVEISHAHSATAFPALLTNDFSPSASLVNAILRLASVIFRFSIFVSATSPIPRRTTTSAGVVLISERGEEPTKVPQ